MMLFFFKNRNARELYERKESPFKDFVSSLFSSRLETRKEGNDALSYVYKILMNSLHGHWKLFKYIILRSFELKSKRSSK